mmetsp:Transcript_46830/g.138404  ORF Transcript_46830/g.138404 Transcript_46830/m.138404 type:complete len:270 (+) Transcript_46830:311-1120(+)
MLRGHVRRVGVLLVRVPLHQHRLHLHPLLRARHLHPLQHLGLHLLHCLGPGVAQAARHLHGLLQEHAVVRLLGRRHLAKRGREGDGPAIGLGRLEDLLHLGRQGLLAVRVGVIAVRILIRRARRQRLPLAAHVEAAGRLGGVLALLRHHEEAREKGHDRDDAEQDGAPSPGRPLAPHGRREVAEVSHARQLGARRASRRRGDVPDGDAPLGEVLALLVPVPQLRFLEQQGVAGRGVAVEEVRVHRLLAVLRALALGAWIPLHVGVVDLT